MWYSRSSEDDDDDYEKLVEKLSKHDYSMQLFELTKPKTGFLLKAPNSLYSISFSP